MVCFVKKVYNYIVIKIFLLKNKRTLLVASAIMFLFVIFILNKTSVFNNVSKYQSTNLDNGLSYSNETIEDLINRDTDGDGVVDWEEGLLGTDPTKKDTDGDGVTDDIELENSKTQTTLGNDAESGSNQNGELSKTEQFSRELFSTIAALNQNGGVNPESIEALSASLADRIQDSTPRKIYSLSDIKISQSETIQAYKNYNSALSDIFKKYPPTNYSVLDVLEKFLLKGEDANVVELAKLGPITNHLKKVINAMLQIPVPSSISVLHLNAINSLQQYTENVDDIMLYESDAIVALSGLTNYQENANKLEANMNNLAKTVAQKLRN